MPEVTGQGPAELFNKNKFQKEKKTGVMTLAVPSLKRDMKAWGKGGKRKILEKANQQPILFLWLRPISYQN